MKKRLLASLLTLVMLLGLLPTAAFAVEGEEDNNPSETTFVAWIGEIGYETLDAAIQEANDGDTIKVGEGIFSTYNGVSPKKSLTFEGSGTDKTTWLVGAEVPREGYVGEYDGDYSFDGSTTVTFRNMTLQYGSKFYLGFARIEHFVVENCVVNGQITYGGTKTATYKDTTFNAPKNDYSFFLCDPTESMTFDGCTFNGDGKFVNVYKDYQAGESTVTVNYKDCTVNSTKPNKSVLNIKDNNNTYRIHISGENSITGLDPNDTTCSRLFQVEVADQNQPHFATVTIDGETVWTDGKMVSHAIDTANDQYTDGYKDDAFTITTSEWQQQADGTLARTTTKVCNYCGYTETTIETKSKYTVSYDLNGGSANGTDYSAQDVIEGDKVTIKAAPSRGGYDFNGWTDGDGTTYAPGDRLAVGKDITLTAQWSKIEDSDPTYGVKYHGTDKTQTFRYDEGEEVKVKDYLWDGREGWIFAGWSEKDGGRVDYEPGDTFDMPAHDINLYPVWVRDISNTEDTGVDKWLNTDDHIQYLYGYPDNTFGPTRNMTRAEAAQMFFNLLRDQNVRKTVSFNDVDGTEWFADAVHTMASLDVLKGYPNGSFQPNKPITRAEFTTMAMQFTNLDQGGSNSFSDVSMADWFYTFVVGASKYGWISGYPDGTFKPNANITRAEVTSIVNNMLGRYADEDYVDDHPSRINSFIDLKDTYWAYYPIMEATNEHDYSKGYQSEDWSNVSWSSGR